MGKGGGDTVNRIRLEYSNHLKIAKQAASEAVELIRKKSGRELQAAEKLGLFDLVSQVDIESEKRILSTIQTAFPDYNLISEERGYIDQGSEYTWVVDPLDGTISFLSGLLKNVAVSIGLLKNNQPVLGVVKRVGKEETLWAVQGEGAFLNNQKIYVSQTRLLKSAVLGSDFQNTAEMRIRDVERYKLFLQKSRYVYALGGAVHSASLVAEGRLDGFVHTLKRWDVAAPAVIILEAGGQVTDWQGNPLDWSKEWLEVVYSNGLIHHQIIEALKELQ